MTHTGPPSPSSPTPGLNVADRNGVRVMREQCASCIFRAGNLMHLERGRTKRMLADAVAADSCIVCHETLGGDVQAVCRGQFDAVLTTPLRVAVAFGAIIEYGNDER
jgi:hypothetical protein